MVANASLSTSWLSRPQPEKTSSYLEAQETVKLRDISALLPARRAHTLPHTLDHKAENSREPEADVENIFKSLSAYVFHLLFEYSRASSRSRSSYWINGVLIIQWLLICG